MHGSQEEPQVNDRAPHYMTELEGIKAPLGVVLYLIKRDNLDIYDIPIAKITKDYLEYLELMEELRIDLAGEFFVLAATLMRIKIQMLLARDEDEEDPRRELVRNLLEYKKIVEAARSFRDMEDERMKVFRRPVPQREKELKEDPVLELNLYGIMRVFREIMAEFDEGAVTEIEPEAFTIEDKIDAITNALKPRGQINFRDLFASSGSRLELIVTFIGVLELMKRGVIRVRQESGFGEIWIYAAAPPSEDERVESGPGADPAGDGGAVGGASSEEGRP